MSGAEGIVRPADLDYLDMIENKYRRMRAALLEMFDTLNFGSALKKHAWPIGTEKISNFGTVRYFFCCRGNYIV